jgi:cyclic pyranopterin monophosphate synthase
MESKLSHYDSAGRVSMVDVGSKVESERSATARAYVTLSAAVLQALPQNKKGNPLEVARIAGIMAAKRTSDLIPLCHPLPLTKVNVEVKPDEHGIEIIATASTVARTGVEMEAMTAACVAALTVYDMTKALDKAIEIREVHLLEKTGGKSGIFRREGTS